MLSMISFIFALLLYCLLCLSAVHVSEIPLDVYPECGEWAERGDCSPNGRPYFMQKNCPQSCHKKTYREPARKKMSEEQNEDFFELTAKDANGKVLRFEDLEGYVTVIVNAARVCEYSEIFWETLEQLHTVHPWALEILAFPFNHPGSNIEKCKDEVEAAEKKGGHKIHIMEPIDINGPNTHPVFKFMKRLFEESLGDEMDPNFAHYFFINGDGNYVELHYGASYKSLKMFVDAHMQQDYQDGRGRMGEF